LREECVSILNSVLNYNRDWKDKREAAMRLGQIPCPSAEKALKQALNDIRVPVREQVVDSLRRISTAISKKAMRRFLYPIGGSTKIIPVVEFSLTLGVT
jgi:hypothetical protein